MFLIPTIVESITDTAKIFFNEELLIVYNLKIILNNIFFCNMFFLVFITKYLIKENIMVNKVCPLRNFEKCREDCAFYVSKEFLKENNQNYISMTGCSFLVLNDQLYEIRNGVRAIEYILTPRM